VLDAAERLFARKGYAAVTLRDIAADVGIRHASLYHHAPGGKEQLFVEVTERNLERHYQGLTQAIATAEPNVRARLRAIAAWLLSQPPMDLVRMVHSDMPAIDPAHAERLSLKAFESMLAPIGDMLEEAARRGEIVHEHPGLIGGGIFGMIVSLFAVPEHALELSREQMAYVIIDAMLDGVRACG
jgi:AcrR family transcriptional regulator